MIPHDPKARAKGERCPCNRCWILFFAGLERPVEVVVEEPEVELTDGTIMITRAPPARARRKARLRRRLARRGPKRARSRTGTVRRRQRRAALAVLVQLRRDAKTGTAIARLSDTDLAALSLVGAP